MRAKGDVRTLPLANPLLSASMVVLLLALPVPKIRTELELLRARYLDKKDKVLAAAV